MKIPALLIAVFGLAVWPSVAADEAPPSSPPSSTSVTSQPFRVLPSTRAARGMQALQLTNLVFDAEIKEMAAKPGEYEVPFTFGVTNVSEEAVVIGNVRTSCGCTVADLPELPWTLEPGEIGSIGITMNLQGKRGSVTKSVFVSSDKGSKTLYVRGIVPAVSGRSDAEREMNLQLATADRQAVFQGSCAACHVTPTIGKMGQPLYVAACGICHDAEHRAEMVPDLAALPQPTNTDYWAKWVTEGKEGTLMPAFAKEHGGPLTDEQIESLVGWLNNHYPPAPAAE